MDWFSSIIRIAGASFPVSSSLVQLQAEIDSKDLSNKVAKFEDPISHLHEDVVEVSKVIYEKLKDEDGKRLIFESDFYSKYSRALAALESGGYIKANHTLGKPFSSGITLIDPSYIVYLTVLAENSDKMEALYKAVDGCEIGQWLDGYKLDIDLPVTVIQSVFDIFESKGYGICSQTIGACKYLGKA